MATALYFLPAILCLLFGFQYFFRKKNRSQRYMMYLLFTGSFYYTTYAFYISPHTDYLWLCRLDSVSEPLFLGIVSLFIAYIHLYINNEKERGNSKNRVTSKNMQWFLMPAIAFGAVNMMMYYLVGFETASRIVESCDNLNVKIDSPEIINIYKAEVPMTILKLFGLFNQTIYNAMAALYVLVLIVSCCFCSLHHGYKIGDVFRFFCLQHETIPAKAASACTMFLIIATAPLLLMGRTYFVTHIWAGIAMTLFIAIALFILTNAEMMSQRKSFTIHDIVTSTLAESGIRHDNDNENNDENEDNAKKKKKEEVESVPGDILAVRTKHIIEKMRAAFE